MAIVSNLRGTSASTFRIGLGGPTIYSGTSDPNISGPTPIDTITTGDFYLRAGDDPWVHNGVDWGKTVVADSLGNVIISNDITVNGQGLFAAGTEATPSISFLPDTDTGFYRTLNDVNVTTGGVRSVQFTAPGIFQYRNGGVPQHRMYRTDISGPAEIAAIRAYGTDSVGAEVLYTRFRHYIRDDTPGAELGTMEFDTMVGGSLTTIAAIRDSQIQAVGGSAVVPSYTFLGDTNTGFFSVGAASGQIGVSLGGGERARFTDKGLWLPSTKAIMYMDTAGNDALGIKRITCNDGSGNWNFHAGVYDDGTDLLYHISTEGGASISLNSESPNPNIKLRLYDGDGAVAGAVASLINEMIINETSIDVGSSIIPDTNNTYNLGSAALTWATMYGESTSALYADLAERYESDIDYPVGTILVIGGTKEVTATDVLGHHAVAGIVSDKPALMMNNDPDKHDWPFIALAGRVPVRVTGEVRRGDRIGTSLVRGVATSLERRDTIRPGTVVGIAMESHDGSSEGVIEVLIRSA